MSKLIDTWTARQIYHLFLQLEENFMYEYCRPIKILQHFH